MLARFDKTSCCDNVLGPSTVFLHFKLIIHDILVVHCQLKLEKRSLADES